MKSLSSASDACVIRPADAADLPAIAEIYNDAVLHSTATFDTQPWTKDVQARWLQQHGHPYAVLVDDQKGEVMGWASLGPYRPKVAYRLTVEDSVYVRSDVQGGGIGALLLARLLEVAADNGFHAVIARIVDGNPTSERLHRRLGFRRVGVEREVGRKFERWLDVVVMQKVLAG
jgi:phosphinothricin acetyltransferase